MPTKHEHNARSLAPDGDSGGVDADTIQRNHPAAGTFTADDAAQQHKHMLAECSPLDEIGVRDEGGLFVDWQLLGVLMLIRHGDRGPMAHVRGVNAINCGVQPGEPVVERYRAFLANATTAGSSAAGNSGGSYGSSGGGGSGRPTWTKTGPFHGNSLLPPFATSCLLGQLTYK